MAWQTRPVISAAMMLEFLGEADAAARIRDAVAKSDDVTGSTTELGDRIAALVRADTRG